MEQNYLKTRQADRGHEQENNKPIAYLKTIDIFKTSIG